ncbi:MAG: hypothetical protein V3U88_12450 [Methylococcales bacterium]
MKHLLLNPLLAIFLLFVIDNTAFAASIGLVYDYQQPPRSMCDHYEDFDNGFLCALRPSRLDAATRDIFDTDTQINRRSGFGYHAIMFPDKGVKIRGVYIHFGGSFGRPFNPVNNTFQSGTFLREAWDSGFIVIQLAYNNRYAVNSDDECGGDLLIDNCAGKIRREKILGGNSSPIADTPVADSIEHRLTRLVEYLENRGIELPINAISNGQINWPGMFLGGHSQGAGQALYIGKYFGARHVCMLAGIHDVHDNVQASSPELIADWFLDTSSTIPRRKLRAILAEDDPFYNQFVSAYGVLSLVENWHWKSFFAEQYFDEDHNEINTGHGAAIKDPSFRELRLRACFTRQYLWKDNF